MSVTVTPVNPPNLTAWQISVDTPADAVDAINTAVALGYKAGIATYIQPNSDPPVLIWELTLTLSRADPGLIAHNTDWLVSDGTKMTVFTATQFTNAYTVSGG